MDLHNTTDPTDAVLEKIKKAVRLANRTTSDAERDTAMRLARNLASKNGLALEDVAVTQADAYAVQVDDTGSERRMNGIEYGLACGIIRLHFGVVVLTNKLSSGKAYFSWFGSRLNIDIARHIHHILVRESRSAYNRAKKEIGDLVKIKRADYMNGFFYAVDRKLTEHPLRNDREQFHAEQKEAERKFEEFSMRNKVKKSRRREVKDASSIIIGMNDGKRVGLARPCERTGASPLAIAL